MTRQLVFIPISVSELPAINGAPVLRDRSAHRVTAELLAELEYSPEQTEDAEYAALVLASVAALASYGQRLVLVAELPSQDVLPGQDLANGGCIVQEVPTAAITCWFSEAPGVDFGAAAAAAKDVAIDTAWEFQEVQDLLAAGDLLWNDVEEYRRANR